MTANTYDKGTDLTKTCQVEKLKQYMYTTLIRSVIYEVMASNFSYAFYSNYINITNTTYLCTISHKQTLHTKNINCVHISSQNL